MSRITGVVVALATLAAVLTGSTVGAEPPPAAATTAALPREIPGGAELTLADGDLLQVWAGDNDKAVWARRRDAATGVWGARQEVLRRPNLFCGDVDARTANGAVAVLAQCDRYGYYEDQAPTSSRAIWSADTVTWSSYRLDGEAYEEPGISPDGVNAVWPLHGGYVTRTAAGFAAHRLDAEGQEYTVTATITDTEQVSFLYGGSAGRGRCGLVVLTRTGDAEPSRQELSFADACSDSSFANLDSDTTWFGDFSSPAFRTVISRADAASPWAVTEIAPAAAPGLQRTAPRLGNGFFTAPGLPLVALGSADRHTIRAQVYDRSTQSWGPPVDVHTARTTCAWGDSWLAEPLDVLVADLRCGGHHVVLTTQDARAWRALRMGKHPYGLSPDGAYVAVPGRAESYVVSRELGVVTLPGGVTGPCEVLVPDGPDAAVLLTAGGRHRGWPTVLQHSSPEGWRRLSRANLPTFANDCRQAQSANYELPYRFDVFGQRDQGYTMRIGERDGEWTVRRSRW
jgi:hypothetical protein